MKRILALTLVLFFFIIMFPNSADAEGAVLSLSPNITIFYVGSTFDVSIMLDTKGQNINAVQVELNFPTDKLQVVEPASGRSIIRVWSSAPTYSNSEGKISFTGGIPNPGINTSSGSLLTLTFRAKSPGKARLSFGSTSKVLLNDGKGTNILGSTIGGIYNIVIPPPQGPIVYSPTHPDQTKWYKNNNPTLAWQPENGGSIYSYTLTRDPATIPDNVSEGKLTSTYYEDLEDGLWYFHIKAKEGSSWGGVSTFLLRIDTEPPADFEIKCDAPRTTNPRPIISFFTTDTDSGVDHYEVKIINISNPDESGVSKFTEEVSPYQLPKLYIGSYDVIVRAFDAAGNWQDSKIRIEIVHPLISLTKEKGITIRGILISWPVAIISLLLILIIIGLLIYLNKRKDRETKIKVREGLENIRNIIDNEIFLLKRKLIEDGVKRENIIEKIEVLEKLKQKTQEGEK